MRARGCACGAAIHSSSCYRIRSRQRKGRSGHRRVLMNYSHWCAYLIISQTVMTLLSRRSSRIIVLIVVLIDCCTLRATFCSSNSDGPELFNKHPASTYFSSVHWYIWCRDFCVGPSTLVVVRKMPVFHIHVLKFYARIAHLRKNMDLRVRRSWVMLTKQNFCGSAHASNYSRSTTSRYWLVANWSVLLVLSLPEILVFCWMLSWPCMSKPVQ